MFVSTAKADTYSIAVRYENSNGTGNILIVPDGMSLYIPNGMSDSAGTSRMLIPTNSGNVNQVPVKTSPTTAAWADPPSSLLPAGVIVMWSGTLASVPSGWALCDGTAGTPDLRQRFIKGWTAGVDPGATGGSATATPAGTISAPTFTGTPFSDVINHTHDVNVTDPGHTHLTQRYPTATGGSTGFTVDTSMSGTLADSTITKSGTTGITAASVNPSSGVASITPAGTVSAPTFTGTSGSNEPAFYTLAYIIKL